MMAPRKGIRARLRSRGKARPPLDRAGRGPRRKGAEAASRERTAARRARIARWRRRTEGVRVRTKGTALETRRRLRPGTRMIGGAVRRLAPYVSRGLFLAVRIPAAIVAVLLDLIQGASRWALGRLGPASATVGELLSTRVTPSRTLAFVAAAAAIALAAAQFVDYRGVAVGAAEYEGEVGSVARVPLTDREKAGDAHLYLLLPVAILAMALIRATYGGRWRLGRAVGLLGLIGIAITLAVDAPQGLDAGRTGIAYTGAGAQLIEGFWAQLAASSVLLFSGPLLGSYARRSKGGQIREDRRSRVARRMRNRRRPDRPRSPRARWGTGA